MIKPYEEKAKHEDSIKSAIKVLKKLRAEVTLGIKLSIRKMIKNGRA